MPPFYILKIIKSIYKTLTFFDYGFILKKINGLWEIDYMYPQMYGIEHVIYLIITILMAVGCWIFSTKYAKSEKTKSIDKSVTM